MNAQFRSLCTADVAPAAAHDAVLHPVHTLDHGIVRHTANEHVKFKVTVAVLLNIGCSGMDCLLYTSMGRMHSDAQFAGSSSVPAHVEMMGFLGMGNNPMVGATVAVAVAVAESQK